LIWDLKEHFSNGAMKEIESILLLSKSNCAFVNYGTETASISAGERFDNSPFQGHRLHCKLRRNSTSVLTALVGLSEEVSSVPSSASRNKSPFSDATTAVNRERNEMEETPTEGGPINAPTAPERFFIIKSLTMQDLEQCVRDSVWTTQAHNEQLLNDAYEVGFGTLFLNWRFAKLL
jgi:YT521-B-like domain